MKIVDGQQINLASQAGKMGVKEQGLSKAGLSIGQSRPELNPENFLDIFKNIKDKDPEAQKKILSEAIKNESNGLSNLDNKEVLLEKMKKDLVDTNVGDSLDRAKLEKQIEGLLEKKTLSQGRAGAPSDDLLALVDVNKKSKEGSLADPAKGKGLPKEMDLSPLGQESETRLAKKNTNQLNKEITNSAEPHKKNDHSIIKANIEKNIGTNTHSQLKFSNESELLEHNPRIPLNLKIKNKNMKSSASRDTGLVADKLTNILDKNSLDINRSNLKIKNYGKTQQNIKNNILNFSGADFNTKVSFENDLGKSLKVEGISQTGGQRNIELISANLSTEAPKGFDVINAKTKVLNLSSLNPQNSIELIDKIANHIKQNKIESSGQIDLLVKHEDLGNFRINVTKSNRAQVDLEIITQNMKGREFFIQNESSLIKSLDQSGVKMSSFRLISGSTHSEFSSFSSESKGQSSDMNQGLSKESHSQSKNSQDGKSDSQRRKELWEEFKENSEFQKSA